MSLSPSPLYASPLSSRGASTVLPADYYVNEVRGGYTASLDGYGQIGGDGADENDVFETYADAAHACNDHADLIAQEKREAAENAADHAGISAISDVVRSARDFLYALDRGDFGKGHQFSDGSESAYVADLRAKLAKVAA